MGRGFRGSGVCRVCYEISEAERADHSDPKVFAETTGLRKPADDLVEAQVTPVSHSDTTETNAITKDGRRVCPTCQRPYPLTAAERQRAWRERRAREQRS